MLPLGSSVFVLLFTALFKARFFSGKVGVPLQTLRVNKAVLRG